MQRRGSTFVDLCARYLTSPEQRAWLELELCMAPKLVAQIWPRIPRVGEPTVSTDVFSADGRVRRTIGQPHAVVKTRIARYRMRSAVLNLKREQPCAVPVRLDGVHRHKTRWSHEVDGAHGSRFRVDLTEVSQGSTAGVPSREIEVEVVAVGQADARQLARELLLVFVHLGSTK